MALAGYAPDDIDITVEQNQLTIKGDVNKMVDDKYSTSVHKGIAERAFTRIFTLGEHVEVKSVFFKNGMLDLELELVLPESKKPRKLTIATK
jgi:molecular chaperone IbpA